ncbi:HAMP domain-containing sensor histidine kinase [Lysobacter sp. H23M47]|uniref:sensor histidine kinase n=1 Tax=Lysobacter sp. H23M47 TaxID=2781024 RepID=UPI001882C096|nr:HAMP domain-containing sensor histidine kinase [Lysobacter sp. H23M47]QOW23481.1 HAMP domain-containing histidine kinase [Lysobacter sp. H23M47]
MKAAGSLQKQLVYGLTLGIVVLWLVATALSGLIVQNRLDDAFDDAMQGAAQRLLPLAVMDILNREEPLTQQRVAPLNALPGQVAYLVRDREGTILLQSRDADLTVFGPPTMQGFSTTPTHRLYGASALRDTLFLQVAEPLSYRRKAARDATFGLLLPLLLLVPASLLGVWLFVRFSLRSVRSYRRAVEARGVGDLSPIQTAPLPLEIRPSADAVNNLIDRLRRALETERRFTANSAHELRTPLAAALAQVQRLRHEAADGPVKERAAQIEASLRELARLAEKLMQLAKAEGGSVLAEVPQDLAMLLNHVVGDLQRVATVPIQLTLPPDGPVLSPIDADAFAILARNLIENALKYGAPGRPINVELTTDARLTVVNAGDVLDPAELAQLTERFVRGSGRAPGYGLGLAIVSTVATAARAELKLASPATDRADGFQASVQFPVAGM